MSKIATAIYGKVYQPISIRKLDTQALTEEHAKIAQLHYDAVAANHARAMELVKLRHAENIAELRSQNSGGSYVRQEHEFSFDQDYIVRKEVLDLLKLRIALCRSELARRNFAHKASHR
jgi:hypothetical protein